MKSLLINFLSAYMIRTALSAKFLALYQAEIFICFSISARFSARRVKHVKLVYRFRAQSMHHAFI